MFDPDFEIFLAVVEAGSVSAASRTAGSSPASFSKRLARLEERVGARLIHRTTRRMELTAQGHVMYHELGAIRAAIDAVEDRVSGREDNPAGPVRLSAPTSFGRLHLAPVLADFAERFPRVVLEVDLSDNYIDLAASRFDLAIRIASHIDPAFQSVRLAGNRRVLCAAPAYVEKHGMPSGLKELSRHRLLAADGQLPWLLEGPGGASAFDGQSAVRTNSSEIVRELTLSGAGIALRSLWDVAPQLRSGALVRVMDKWEGSRDAGVHVVHAPAHRPGPAVRALVQMLEQRFSDGRAEWEREDPLA